MIIDTYTVKVRFDIDKTSLRNIGNYLNQLKRQFNIPVRFRFNQSDIDRARRIGDSLRNAGGNPRASGGGSVADGMSATVMSFAGDQAKKAVIAAANYEEKMIDVKVALNAVGDGSEDQMKKITDLTQKIGSTTRFTATQAAEAAEMLVRNGVSADSIINGMLQSTVTMSIAMRSDMKETADLMTDVMMFYKQMGVTAEEAANKVVAATLTSKFGFRDMAYAMARGGTVASAYGIELKELSAVLAGISPGFKSGAEAGTSFKWFLKSLNGKSGKAKKLMDSMGLDFVGDDGKYKSMRDIILELEKAFKGLSEAERNATINRAFHGYSLNAVIGLLNMGVKGYDELIKKQAVVSAQEIARQKSAQGLTEAYYKLTSAVEGFYLAVINQDVLNFLSSMTLDITKMINAASSEIPELYSALGSLKGAASAYMTKDANGNYGGGPAFFKSLVSEAEANSKASGIPIGFDSDTPEWVKSTSNWFRRQIGLPALGDKKYMLERNPFETKRKTSLQTNPFDKVSSSSSNSINVSINQSFRNSDPTTVRRSVSIGLEEALANQLNAA